MTVTTEVERVPVVVEVWPLDVPAADLPAGLIFDVAQVLRAHGLDPDLLSLSTGLYGVITATPVELGGTGLGRSVGLT